MAADRRIYDSQVIQHDATNAAERRNVLDAALVQWAADDVGKIQRIEPAGGNFYYAMWIYPRGKDSSESP